MSANIEAAPPKWRPSLGLFAACLIVAITVLPLVSLVFLRLYENLLIRQTEAELIGQSAVLAAAMSEMGGDLAPGAEAQTLYTNYLIDTPGRFAPIEPALDLATDTVLPPRPPPRPGRLLSEAENRVGTAMAPLLEETQRVTLAGFRILSADGMVLAGGQERGLSLAHVAEVAEAIDGRFTAVMRDRYSDEPAPPVTSLSRGTKVRLFTAMPAIRDGHVIGVVYASRTPQNVVRDLYMSRGRVALAALLTLIGAALVGAVFVRVVARPIVRLRARAEAVAADPTARLRPLPHHGSQEVASLADSLGRMAAALTERSDYVRTFAAHVSHELKAPLTAIAGAAEVLEDEDLSDVERATFHATISREVGRMTRLLDRLRELSRAENPKAGGYCLVSDLGPALAGYDIDLRLAGLTDAVLPLSIADATAAFGHLADNAARHGARTLTITAYRDGAALRLEVQDDGGGVPPAVQPRLFEAFFTTRRLEGGTGMGLGIARALLRAHGGELAFDASCETGARFVVSFPGGG